MQCYYCERKFSDLVIKTRDHIIPVSRGGKNCKENRVFACQKCNSAKSNMLPEEFCTFLRGCQGQKGRNVETMLKNAEALVFEIAPYRDDLIKPGGILPPNPPKPKGRKGFLSEWITTDKDTVILSEELKANTERVIKMADAAKAKSAYKDWENWH